MASDWRALCPTVDYYLSDYDVLGWSQIFIICIIIYSNDSHVQTVQDLIPGSGSVIGFFNSAKIARLLVMYIIMLASCYIPSLPEPKIKSNIFKVKHEPTRIGEILSDIQVRVTRTTNKNKLKNGQ